MTSAPGNLLAVRRLLLDHLDIDPSRARSIDLESAEVGIVGDSAHRGGYHCGSDRVDRNSAGTITDYSVVESARDRAGLTLDAAALDVGMFTVTTPKGTYDLPHFSAWCVGQCKAGAPDTRDIREIIWSPDGRTVRRWDALGRRTTGDDSHRWHTHFSFFRDAIKAGRDLTPLFRRYLIHIGLLAAPEDDMTEAELIAAFQKALTTPLSLPGRVGDRMVAAGWSRDMEPWTALARVVESVVLGRPAVDVDEQALAAELAGPLTAALSPLLSVLTPQAIAAAIPAELAGQVADEIAARLAD